MYHYHKKIHEPIPDNQLCAHGCNSPALFRGTGGKYTCHKNAHRCPEYIKRHSARIAKQWEGATARKEAAKESFVTRIHNEENYNKLRATLKKKWGNFTPEQMKDFRHYARRIRSRAQKWAKDQGYVLGQQTYHVDHKLSIWDAWGAGLSEEIVNHPINLQILEAKKNSSKGAKSILTVEELLNLINLNDPSYKGNAATL